MLFRSPDAEDRPRVADWRKAALLLGRMDLFNGQREDGQTSGSERNGKRRAHQPQHICDFSFSSRVGKISLMLGKIEGRRRSGQQRMRWLDNITYSMEMNLNKFRKIADDRGACCY